METVHSLPPTLFTAVLLLTWQKALGQEEYISKELFLIVVTPLYGLFFLLVLVLLIVCCCSCCRRRADNSQGPGIYELAKKRVSALVTVEKEPNVGKTKKNTGESPAERVTSHIYDTAEDDQQTTKHAAKSATVAAPARKGGTTTPPARAVPAHPATRQAPPTRINDGGSGSLASGNDAVDMAAVQIRPYMPMILSMGTETQAGQQQPHRPSRSRPPTYEVYLHPLLPPPGVADPSQRVGDHSHAAPLPPVPASPPAPPLPLRSHAPLSPEMPSPAEPLPRAPLAERSPGPTSPEAVARVGVGLERVVGAGGATAAEAEAEAEEEEENDCPVTVYDTPRAKVDSALGVTMATTSDLGDLGLLGYCSVGEAAAALHSRLLAAEQKADHGQPVPERIPEDTELPKEVEKTQL